MPLVLSAENYVKNEEISRRKWLPCKGLVVYRGLGFIALIALMVFLLVKCLDPIEKVSWIFRSNVRNFRQTSAEKYKISPSRNDKFANTIFVRDHQLSVCFTKIVLSITGKLSNMFLCIIAVALQIFLTNILKFSISYRYS